ncbi:hypothetical protein LCGC14_1187050 [marine sediment metagenome]|uniref:Uncharacterized protein n=1 Tax=marine sediment metagenome TaxID=412755 RepID=A0A0F9LQA4_9ZZZZ
MLCPVNFYLNEFVELTTENFTSSGNTLVSYNWPATLYFTYDSNGFISEIKWTNNTVLMERWGIKGQSSEIPGYDLTIVMGLTTVTVLSLVYIWQKKRLK